MKSKKYFLGIDTSCYTTSVCLMDNEKNIISDARVVLTVDEGKKGLRQSEAFFQHVNNLPGLYAETIDGIDTSEISSVVVSVKPREVEDSYMPVFKSGEAFARVISDTLNVPLIRTSHQEGHLYAAVLEYGIEAFDGFTAIQISGGTTEILKVKRHGINFQTKKVGGTLDISFGQLIDRIGVKLGFGFPCGKAMEKELEQMDIDQLDQFNMPFAIKGNEFNLSGIENKIGMLWNQFEGHKNFEGIISYNVFLYLAKILEKIIIKASDETYGTKVIIIGGVASNKVIRKYLKESAKLKSFQIYFGKPEYSSDNGVGNAYLGMLNK